jgi:predicted SprT family Zn-dependent metalloprotease
MKWAQLDFIGRLLSIPQRVEIPHPPIAAPAPIRQKPTGPRGEDIALTARGAELLQANGCAEIASRLRVCWSPQLHSTAGLAFPGKAMIKLNPRLKEFGEAEVERTFLHELAHLLAHGRAGRRRIQPHGTEWRRACADLGLKDERRCHNLPLPRREIARRHIYICPACGFELRRVRPIRRASACLPCCRKHSGGRYDERFRFIKKRLP